ncbi:MAG: hypothetical protein DRI01_09485 [Chloroflexi bacterium]|nr:MAG: hypothetical protein DRI01_09485 [Chloroflexota bacterium]
MSLRKKKIEYLERVVLYVVKCTSDGKTYTTLAMYKDYDLARQKAGVLQQKGFRHCIVIEMEV